MPFKLLLSSLYNSRITTLEPPPPHFSVCEEWRGRFSITLFVLIFEKSLVISLAALGLYCCLGSLVASGGYSPVAVHRLLTVGRSLKAQARGLTELVGSSAQAQ